ncbi:GGDEF domain-containing protein [Pseudoalteromonas luteoviolacea]|uniref:sensor domain-containing diguanylate cyclase n=1 Tax=Pseudoalteromonas luteoviolacea TaxID=43657 RepID=UPI001B39EAA4|nr:sensor domain-containing diguanylate cyclase [Pseudoalteromonas luteoviolacea]MBQ4878978.1 GGDEF domain-containing protein [Pseudoalteromonas luteoviolacea]MBQ4908071.1 GGDEF domain-containing protein [Pseudoalteromonas luteoviolacea]
MAKRKLLCVLRHILRIDLKKLILALATCGVVLSLLNTLFASYQVHKEAFIKDTLHANQTYATKLAEVTQLFLQSVNSQLNVSAFHIAENIDDTSLVNAELERLLSQTNSFDSLVVASADGQIIAVRPELPVLGQSISSQQLHKVMLQKPVVLDPFVSPAGNLMISPTYPLFDGQGQYLGFVAGGIYLHGDTILNRLLGRHHYADGSYSYVVDKAHRILYHPDPDRIGEQVSNNVVIDRVLNGQTGAMELVNSSDKQMIAGFAAIPMTGWGVVSQRPLISILNQLAITHRSVVYSSVPFTIVILGWVFVVGFLIARPLTVLAKQLTVVENKNVSGAGVSAWYYEVANLKCALLQSHRAVRQVISALDADRKTDKLTALHNRLSLDLWLENAIKSKVGFSVLAIDIDHFKSINDSHGHCTGDKVLKELAKLMIQNARANDFCCRVGGEEFLIFMPNQSLSQAMITAERLRTLISNHTMPNGIRVTVSIGVSQWPNNSMQIDKVIEMADKALYQAKQSGRNKSCCLEAA